VDKSISFIPFLVIVLLEVVMSRVDREVADNGLYIIKLFEQIVESLQPIPIDDKLYPTRHRTS
jgi:hypothetical protein